MPLGELYDFDSGMIQIGDACKAIGRDPKSVVIRMFFAEPKSEKVKALPDMGCSSAVFYLPSQPAAVVLPILDQYAKMM